MIYYITFDEVYMLIRRLFMIVLIIISGYVTSIAMAAPPITARLQENRQLVHVHSLSGTKGVLDTWDRDELGQWSQVMAAVPVVIGHNGAVAEADKREGDGCTPKGLYALGMGFGYQALEGVKIPYKVLDKRDFWVDDPKSPAYNSLVRGRPKNGSYEVMRRNDQQYSHGLVVEYNTKPTVAYRGSAIFLHVWRNPDAVTAGCVAMAAHNMRNLLLWLDPSKKPVIMIE